ncbi:hypothetical protein CKO51_04875 [Rhodopirellula sp. SM50]|nr:hypothetical protein [Rhodopirellula sp. SM50]PAY20632.1 hypothetical protein CKO51_04875 [Rhodopirellula sp. SM50]
MFHDRFGRRFDNAFAFTMLPIRRITPLVTAFGADLCDQKRRRFFGRGERFAGQIGMGGRCDGGNDCVASSKVNPLLATLDSPRGRVTKNPLKSST